MRKLRITDRDIRLLTTQWTRKSFLHDTMLERVDLHDKSTEGEVMNSETISATYIFLLE